MGIVKLYQKIIDFAAMPILFFYSLLHAFATIPPLFSMILYLSINAVALALIIYYLRRLGTDKHFKPALILLRISSLILLYMDFVHLIGIYLNYKVDKILLPVLIAALIACLTFMVSLRVPILLTVLTINKTAKKFLLAHVAAFMLILIYNINFTHHSVDVKKVDNVDTKLYKGVLGISWYDTRIPGYRLLPKVSITE